MIELDDLSKAGFGLRVNIKELITESSQLDEIIKSAVKHKINLLDIVNTLGIGRVEKRIGRILQDLECREDLFIITKGGVQWDSSGIFRPDGDPESIKEGVMGSIELLGIDKLDCYQIYWPDEKVPLDETVAALEELKKDGFIRHIGLTNFSTEQIKDASRGGTIDFIQFPFSLFQRQAEKDLLPFCREKNIRTLIYGVLCRGLLTDDFLDTGSFKFDNMQTSLNHVKENFPLYQKAVRKIADYLEEENIKSPLSSSLISWTLKQRGVSHALVVAHTPEHIQMLSEADDLDLTSAQVERITEITDEIVGENVEEEFITLPHTED